MNDLNTKHLAGDTFHAILVDDEGWEMCRGKVGGFKIEGRRKWAGDSPRLIDGTDSYGKETF